jgi:hypothetical protein
VGLISVDHEYGSKEIKVFVKLYFDDFLLDYKLFDDREDLQEYAENVSFPKEKLSPYVANRLILFVDGMNLEGNIVNVGIKDNEMEVNLVYPLEKECSSLNLNVSFLADLYDDQANMTIVKIGEKEEGIKFSATYREKTFSLLKPDR